MGNMAPKVLELFAGKHSFGRWAVKQGYEVVSLDILRTSTSTHTCDILDFDYTQYHIGYFSIIWASPPCTQYSYARSTGPPRDIVGANEIVKRTFEIIEYLKPERWGLENPFGWLRRQDFMMGKPYMVIDYCQMSTPDDCFPYRKRTCIWSDVQKPDKKCDRACDGMDVHKKGHTGTFCGKKNLCLSKKYRIPQALFDYVFK